ncbi:nucleotide exchange factor GrpE [Spirulina subsalsa FACHB-351]|uniref:Protein GrpE n=2 Tax=Spirulina subsalsa TaxID=54311 RepID=A0ABT3KZM9_9CYAN|nr:nucleotide exchange factor GrpE [Spirulina subsalsa FACHB-351]
MDEQKQPEVNIDQPDEGAEINNSESLDSETRLDEQATGEATPTPEGETVTPQGEEPNIAPETHAVSSEQAQIIEALQLEVESLRQQLAEQGRQLETYKAQSLRIAADFDNFRKRTQKEKEEQEYHVKRNTITELLPVVDNFERARSQIKPATEAEMVIHKSYQSVYKNLVDGLKRIGVSAMRPEGQEFDPNFHEAMLRQPTEEYPEGAVMEQLVRGYLLHDRVLRHAMVKVAAAPEPPMVSEEEAPPEEGEGE